MKILNLILREFGTLLLAGIAIALVYPWVWIGPIPISLLSIGVLYTFSKPFYDYRGNPFTKRLQSVLIWIFRVLYEVWVVFKKIFLFIGYVIDLYGNVILGELIEDIVTAKEDTYFGKGNITISAALGDLKLQGKLNKRGLWFCDVLSKLDPVHEDHCIAAIDLYNFKQRQKK